ncbi:hypothetical protein ACFL6I_00620 [candidate division KSB1 bacterium]
MLKRLLAPAQFFLFRPQRLNQFFSGKKNSANPVPEKTTLLNARAVQGNPAPKDTYTLSQTTRKSLNIFENISAEKFVKNLLSANDTSNSQSTKSQSLDLKVRYAYNTSSTRKTSATGQPARRITRNNITRNYRSSGQLQAQHKNRSSQINLFYRQTEKLESGISTERIEDYRGVRDKIAAHFNYDFSIDFSFLQQFTTQSQRLNEHGEEAFQGYLDTTDTLIDRSVNLTRTFFNTVDALLDDSRQSFLKRIEQFFNDLKDMHNGNASSFDEDKEIIIRQVTSFFDKVDTLLDKAESEIVKALETSPLTHQAESLPAEETAATLLPENE